MVGTCVHRLKMFLLLQEMTGVRKIRLPDTRKYGCCGFACSKKKKILRGALLSFCKAAKKHSIDKIKPTRVLNGKNDKKRTRLPLTAFSLTPDILRGACLSFCKAAKKYSIDKIGLACSRKKKILRARLSFCKAARKHSIDKIKPTRVLNSKIDKKQTRLPLTAFSLMPNILRGACLSFCKAAKKYSVDKIKPTCVLNSKLNKKRTQLPLMAFSLTPNMELILKCRLQSSDKNIAKLIDNVFDYIWVRSCIARYGSALSFRFIFRFTAIINCKYKILYNESKYLEQTQNKENIDNCIVKPIQLVPTFEYLLKLDLLNFRISTLPSVNLSEKCSSYILNYKTMTVPDCRKKVLQYNLWLDDIVLDLFLIVLRNNSEFKPVTTWSINYFQLVEPVKNNSKDIQIIGGTPDFPHWHCLYFDGRKLHIYDSSDLDSYDLLVPIEKEFIKQRYPNISRTDVIFESCPKQQDNYSCGVFAAANATMLALGHNPSAIGNYAAHPVMYNQTESTIMRIHLLRMLEKNKLKAFRWNG